MPGQPFPFIERVNQVSTVEPWRWLAAGWEDLRAARMKSVAYSIPFVLAGYAVTFGLYQAGLHYLIWPALSGFFLLHRDMLELAREVAAEVSGPSRARALHPPPGGRPSFPRAPRPSTPALSRARLQPPARFCSFARKVRVGRRERVVQQPRRPRLAARA